MHKTTVILIVGILIFLQGCTAAIVAGGAAGAGVIHDRRTTGAMIEDEAIEIKAVNRIGSDKELSDRSHINVTSYNSIVLLTGESPTQALRSRAEQIVRDIPKVRRIHNEIILASPSAFSSRSSDTWITTKVKTNLFKINGIKGFDATRVKVVTENGVVFLMGLVTHAEESSVVSMASKVAGVQRIIKVFEYID